MVCKAALATLALLVLWGCSLGGSGPTDTASPQVVITRPLAGDTVTSQVSIDVLATDDFGVDKVRFLIDGVLLTELFTAPYHVTWNTALLPNNSDHVIKVEAIDLAKNTAFRSITVTVVRGPQ